MIEVEMPKDISKVETKFLGLITFRTAIGLIVALILTFSMRRLIGDNEALQDLKSILTIITAGVPFAFAIYRPYGMSLYAFLIQYIYNNILSPKKRVYKINNKYEKIIEEERQHEEFIIYQYDRIHHIKHRDARIDKAERPKVKKCKKKSLTGYI